MKRFLIVSDELRDFVAHLPPALKKKIRSGLDEILHDPKCGKKLKEDLHGFRSYKLGQIRIIYRVLDPSIELVMIGPRKTVYQKAMLALREMNL